jgi:NAD(P)-dependent dehydrogenase (short-subunit alcohol dehydrogenase family)
VQHCCNCAKQKKGLVLWVESTSTRGGTPAYLSLYFAVKAAMDALAVSYAAELNRWGIETSIIIPGAFTSGTNHFSRAGAPADKARQAEYDNGPYAHLGDDIMKGFAATRLPMPMWPMLQKLSSAWWICPSVSVLSECISTPRRTARRS